MTSDNKTRNIAHKLADVSSHLSDDYTLTVAECDPGDSAVRVIKRNSDETLYAIAYGELGYTEIRLYDKNDDLAIQCSIYSGTPDDLTSEDIADHIKKIF